MVCKLTLVCVQIHNVILIKQLARGADRIRSQYYPYTTILIIVIILILKLSTITIRDNMLLHSNLWYSMSENTYYYPYTIILIIIILII